MNTTDTFSRQSKPALLLRPVLTVALILTAICTALSGSAAGQSPAPPKGLARVSTSRERQTDFALKDGDRVVFFGDSITEQRLYTTYVEQYVLIHYPERHITFINSGWGGDQVTSNDCGPCAGVGALARIKRDVIDLRPTVVTLLFGMNDGHYQDFDPALLNVYENGLTAIIRRLKDNTGARIYVMTPTVYDGTQHTPWSKTTRYNDVLDRYSEAAKQIARREGLPVIDLHTLTTDALREAKTIDASYTFLPDGVHPEPDGQLVMAAAILRAWGAPAEGETIVRQAGTNGTIGTDINVTAPLPWPEPVPSEKMRKVRPEIMEMGEVKLKLTGLSPGNYIVRVDGSDGSEYTSEQLGAGIPISSLSAPANEASRALAALIRQRADLYFTRWRQIEIPLSGEYKGAGLTISALDSLADEMNARARLLGKPHEYHLSLSRVP